MREAKDIIPDDQLLLVHGHSNFGAMTPREVIEDGIRKYAIGYQGGSTQFEILREHRLISCQRDHTLNANLTAKGKEYARAMAREGKFFREPTRTN